MSYRLRVLGVLLLSLGLGACSDSTTPGDNQGDPPVGTPDEIPHDFVVTTEPSPVQAGAGATISARWSDSNLNATAVEVTMEGARIIGDPLWGKDEELRQYEYRLGMVMPEFFTSNLLNVQVSDPDSQVTHVQAIEIEGGWPPLNTPPHEVSISFSPETIGAGQTVSVNLQGKDNENNMAPGITARYAAGEDIVFRPGSPGFTTDPGNNGFAYTFTFIAPPDTGTFAVEMTVRDDKGQSYVFTESFQVTGSNRPPFYTEIRVDDRIVQGISDRLDFRVAAMDPNGNKLFLGYECSYGSLEVDPNGEARGDTTVWTGVFVPSNAEEAFLTFQVSDFTVEVESETYDILVDHSGRPVLDLITIDPRKGEHYSYDPYRVIAAPGYRGEEIFLELFAHDPNGSALTFTWNVVVDGKSLSRGGQSSSMTYVAPDRTCIIKVDCRVSDLEGYQVHPRSIEIFVE